MESPKTMGNSKISKELSKLTHRRILERPGVAVGFVDKEDDDVEECNKEEEEDEEEQRVWFVVEDDEET